MLAQLCDQPVLETADSYLVWIQECMAKEQYALSKAMQTGCFDELEIEDRLLFESWFGKSNEGSEENEDDKDVWDGKMSVREKFEKKLKQAEEEEDDNELKEAKEVNIRKKEKRRIK